MKHKNGFEITCIVCPIGCRIKINETDGHYVFTGNRCSKGAEFAKTEAVSPVRSLTTTVRTIFPEMPVLPVKTKGEVPKGKISQIILELSKITITERINIGETIVENILGTGCDIIATSGAWHQGRCDEQ